MTGPQAIRPLRQSRSPHSARPRQLHIEALEDRRMLAGRAAEAINLFALDVYEQMQREQGNLFFSPLSIVTGLAMAYAGAAAQTADEMEQVLHLGEEPGIHDAFAELMDSIAAHNETLPGSFSKQPHVLTVANALWQDLDYPVDQNYLELIQNYYDGHVQNVDYADPQNAQSIINQWVSERTKGKIPNLVSNLSPLTVMVLTNAVYFNGYWDAPFDPRYTANRPFTLASGETISIPTMYTELLSASYATFEGYAVLELPFDGGSKGADYSMVLVLPPENGGDSLTPELFSQIDAWMDLPPEQQFQREVLVSLPKINTAVSNSFKQLLSDLGMPTAFTLGAADFSPAGLGGAAIYDVFHKATLTINEQGTTAAAATEINFFICFAAGTPVLTPEGAKTIEKLKEGDLVLARDENNVEGELQPKLIEKVHRRDAAILELRVRGQLIRTTDGHPFFVKGKGWTPAGELRPRDLLSTSSAAWAEVEAVEITSFSQPVYNLRVADYHTYFVGREEWDFAVWVHNACSGEEPEFFADRPFHLLIRDNITSAIAFMGRIDDPRQLENIVAPVVVAPNADFDGNLTVDGADFLAWQRGFGTTSSAGRSDGDSNADGEVDVSDLAEWRQAFGQDETLPSAVMASSEIPWSANVKTDETLSAADLLDAAMALDWLASEGTDEDAAPVDDPRQIPQQASQAFDDEPMPAPAPVNVAFDSLTLTSEDGQPADVLELDDDPLALSLE